MAIVKFDRSLYRNGNHAKGMSYGQIEPNQVWFNRAGMVEAQCYLDTECFSDTQVAPLTKYVPNTAAAGQPSNAVKIVAQNGAFLMVDKANYTATIPNTADSENGFPMGINYSTEKIYNQFTPQRRNFFLTTSDWLPRIGYVDTGMRITTNTVQWDTTTNLTGTDKNGQTVTLDLSSYTDPSQSFDVFAAIRDFINSGAKTPIYACVVDGSDGELVIGADPDDALGNVWAQLVAAYDNADRTCSFMFQIINKPV